MSNQLSPALYSHYDFALIVPSNHPGNGKWQTKILNLKVSKYDVIEGVLQLYSMDGSHMVYAPGQWHKFEAKAIRRNTK